jgi:iron complex outermembrane receptor protein
MGYRIIALLACCAIWSAAWAVDLNEQKTFDIPAQKLTTALVEFSRQAGAPVVSSTKDVDRFTSPSVSGRMSVREALTAMLAGTGLEIKTTDNGAIVIRPAPSSGKVDASETTKPIRSTNAAPESALESQALGEIIVTAQRRETSLQDVSASVSAISGSDLQKRGIADFNELATSIPSLSFTETGEGHSGARTISIRGVASSSSVNIGETTGFYIDDTPVPYAVDPKLFDVERIEVLRGPQGTLYGARSMGGTVKIITNPADPDATAGRIAVGSDYVEGGGAGYVASGTLNVPLVADASALRLSAFYNMIPGVQDKEVTSTDQFFKHVDDSHNAGAMLSGLWKLGDGWELSPKLLYQSSTYDGLPFADYRPDNTLQIRDQNVSEAGDDHWTLASITLRKQLEAGEVMVTASHFDRSFIDREDASEFIQFIAGAVFDAPFTGASPVSKYQNEKIWTYEGRFVSGWEGPFKLVSGIYYQDRQKTRDFLETAPGFGTATGTGTDLIFDGGDTTTEKEFAVYSEGTLQFGTQWALTAGARWFDSNVNVDRATGGLFGGGTLDRTTHNTDATPKVALTYEPLQDIRIYASASEGYRLGGVNYTIPTPGACSSPSDLADYQELHSGTTYKPDSLWNYEIGAKTEFLDRKLRINAAAFVMDWRNIQQSIQVCGFNLTVNAGTARSTGGEIEATALVTRGLTISLDASKIRAVLTDSVPLLASSGSRILGVPDWQVHASLDWVRPLAGEWNGFLRPQITYTGSEVFTFTPSDNPASSQGGTTDYDLRFGVTNAKWEIALYGTNLANVRRSFGPDTSLAAALPGRPRLAVNATRTVGIQVVRSF